jgi:hypothetical protein
MTTKPTSFTESAGTARKPYESPRLEVYGDIREIAKTAGNMGGGDGAIHGNNKTG